MKKMLFLVLIASFLSCKKEVKIAFQKKESLKLDLEKNPKKLDTVAYFENALDYEYEQDDKKEELWIYVNEQKKELLFVPNDDMIQAVISYPNGMYKIFGTDYDGSKIILTQTINAVLGQEIEEPMLKKTRNH